MKKNIKIIYEDPQILVLDKPAGLVVHEEKKKQKSLVDWIIKNYPQVVMQKWERPDRPGIVHRIDKDTSGLLVIAKTKYAYEKLKKQIQNRKIKKIYLGLLEGKIKPPKDIIVAKIGRKPGKWGQMTTLRGKEAKTYYELLDEYKLHNEIYSLVQFKILTGRTHQIRVHAKFIGHPIMGDLLYGTGSSKIKSKKLGITRQFLHSHILGFAHPIFGKWLEFKSELPTDLAQIIAKFKT